MPHPAAVNSDLSYSKRESWKMFNDISGRYDFLNKFLSFGLDIGWRNRLSRYLPKNSNLKLLDLATGTGDVILTLMKRCPRITSAVGIDMADQMLEIGRKKVEQAGFAQKIKLQPGNANHTMFDHDIFDAVTIAFGIRNVPEPMRVLAEMQRVLKKGGRALVLEFSIPQNPIIKAVSLFYLRNILPFLGAFISGNPKAYRYLNQTVEIFPHGEEFCAMLEEAGFQNVKAIPLTFGIATIYQGEKIL